RLEPRVVRPVPVRGGGGRDRVRDELGGLLLGVVAAVAAALGQVLRVVVVAQPGQPAVIGRTAAGPGRVRGDVVLDQRHGLVHGVPQRAVEVDRATGARCDVEPVEVDLARVLGLEVEPGQLVRAENDHVGARDRVACTVLDRVRRGGVALHDPHGLPDEGLVDLAVQAAHLGAVYTNLHGSRLHGVGGRAGHAFSSHVPDRATVLPVENRPVVLAQYQTTQPSGSIRP